MACDKLIDDNVIDAGTTIGDTMRNLSDEELAELLLNTFCVKNCNRSRCRDKKCDERLRAGAIEYVKSSAGKKTDVNDIIAASDKKINSVEETQSFIESVFDHETLLEDRRWDDNPIQNKLAKQFDNGEDEAVVDIYKGKLLRITIPGVGSITGIGLHNDDGCLSAIEIFNLDMYSTIESRYVNLIDIIDNIEIEYRGIRKYEENRLGYIY